MDKTADVKLMTKIAIQAIELINDMEEDAGYEILAVLRKHFHFEGSLYGRGDFESILGRELTDDEWRNIYQSNDFYYELCERSDASAYAIQTILDNLGIGE